VFIEPLLSNALSKSVTTQKHLSWCKFINNVWGYAGCDCEGEVLWGIMLCTVQFSGYLPTLWWNLLPQCSSLISKQSIHPECTRRSIYIRLDQHQRHCCHHCHQNLAIEKCFAFGSCHGPQRNHRSPSVAFVSVAAGTCLPSCFPKTADPRTRENTVLSLFHACMLQTLPNKGRCLATGLYITI
jgi:hypothetical protein